LTILLNVDYAQLTIFRKNDNLAEIPFFNGMTIRWELCNRHNILAPGMARKETWNQELVNDIKNKPLLRLLFDVLAGAYLVLQFN